MDKTLPKAIRQFMEEEDYNSCDVFEYGGEIYYSLGNVSEDGTPFPEGLPVICTVKNGKAFELKSEYALELLSKLPDDE